MKKAINIVLTAVMLISVTGCSQDYEFNQSHSSVTPIENISVDRSMQKEDDPMYYGVWYLDRVVLRSEMYSDDIEKNGEIIPVNVENYLGYEIEYSAQYFRLGEEIYMTPVFHEEYRTVDDVNEGGKFRPYEELQDFYGFIDTEDIEIDNMEDYQWLSDVQLLEFSIEFDPYSHIPVGSNGYMLNANSMLVGTWGEIILAHRVQP